MHACSSIISSFQVISSFQDPPARLLHAADGCSWYQLFSRLAHVDGACVCGQVHSAAYGVPVLFLRGCTTDGAVLPAETVWQDVCAPNSWPVHHSAADWLTDSVRTHSRERAGLSSVRPPARPSDGALGGDGARRRVLRARRRVLMLVYMLDARLLDARLLLLPPLPSTPLHAPPLPSTPLHSPPLPSTPLYCTETSLYVTLCAGRAHRVCRLRESTR